MTTDEESFELPNLFEEFIRKRLAEDSEPIMPCFARHHDGKLTLADMAMPGEMIFETAAMRIVGDLSVKEAVFGIDRFAKEGQGNKYNDLVTVFWWYGPRGNMGWKFGVIHYIPPPFGVVDPIDWNNEFWNAQMQREVEEHEQLMRERVLILSKRLGISQEQLDDLIKRRRAEQMERIAKGRPKSG